MVFFHVSRFTIHGLPRQFLDCQQGTAPGREWTSGRSALLCSGDCVVDASRQILQKPLYAVHQRAFGIEVGLSRAECRYRPAARRTIVLHPELGGLQRVAL